jgi:hypothetical protein
MEKTIINYNLPIFHSRFENKATFNIERLKFVLELNGFRSLHINEADKEQDIRFVHINKNRAQIVNIIYIRNFITRYFELARNGDTFDFANAFNQKYNNAKLKEICQQLKPIELDKFQRDTQDSFYFYFKNNYVKVTENDIEILNYDKLDKYIWQRHSSGKDFKIIEGKSDFETFLERAAFNKEQTECAIGYLLHEYKNPSIPKAVVICDTGKNERKGGCGKSLIAKSLRKLRNQVEIPGGRCDLNDNFLFQDVDLDTRLILFDDIRDNFEFDKLFTSITGNLQVKRKYLGNLNIPFKYSPKFVITTNRLIKTLNQISYKRRLYEVLLTNYYNENRTPYQELGRLLFDDWDENDWNKYYLYIFRCCQQYLRYGLIDIDSEELRNKRIIEETNILFYEFAVEFISFNEEYGKKEMYQKYIEIKEHEIKRNTFTRWLKLYADLNSAEYIERRTSSISENNIVFFKIKKPA